MAPPLDPETIKIVKSTAPVLEVYGTTITKTFYGIMFEEFAQVKRGRGRWRTRRRRT